MLKKTWNYLSNNGVKPEHTFEDTKRIRILNQFSIVTIILSLSYAISFLIIQTPVFAIAVEITLFISGFVTYFLINKFHYSVAAFFLFLTAPFGLMLQNYNFGETGAEYFFFSAFILSFYLFRNPWYNGIIGLYLFALFILSQHFGRTIMPRSDYASYLPDIQYSNVIFTFIVGFVFLRLFVREHEKHQKEIEVKNNLLEQSVEVANQKSKEIKILLKELSHRTKNNLQLVSSLINIQSSKLPDSEAKKAMEDSKNRIISIALIHKKLYMNERLTTVSFKEYAHDLIQHLIEIFDDKTDPVKITSNIDDFYVKIDSAVSLGLIINELLTNSFKHGLVKNKIKFINFSIQKLPKDMLEIYISDSGKGLDKLSGRKDSTSFGVNLIRLLVRQMSGSIRFAEDNENSVRIKLSILR